MLKLIRRGRTQVRHVHRHGPRCTPYVCYCVIDLTDAHRERHGRRVSDWMVDARTHMPAPAPPPPKADTR